MSLNHQYTKIKLGDILEVQNGYAFKSALFSDEQGTPLIRIRDLEQEKAETFYTGEYEEKYLVKNGDLLIGMDGDFICSYWKGGEALLNQRVCRLQNFSRKVNRDYIYYFIQDELKKIHAQTSFVTVKHISSRQISEIECWLPPLPVQNFVVDILKRAESILQIRKEQIVKARLLIPTLFVDMFGDFRINNKNYPIVSMESVIHIDAPMVDPKEERYLDLIHIGPDRIEKETGKLLPALTAREENLISNKFLFDDRYLLYSKIRPYLKKAALPNFSGLCSADMYPVRPQEGVSTREFIFALLLSGAFTEYTKTLAGRASIPKLNRTELNAYKFPLPPLKDQERFSTLLRDVFGKIDLMETALKKQEMLFQSLLHYSFEGNLTQNHKLEKEVA